MIFRLLIFVFHLALASASQKPLATENQHAPSIASVIQNANLLFNAVHSSMRQWGSSIQHNGMSFFPAFVPEGTLLYHGSGVPDRPKGPEWLAFEIPHAEMFANVPFTRGRKRRNQTEGGKSKYNSAYDLEFLDPRIMFPPYLEELENTTSDDPIPGYVQIYQATRPLKVLYLDGMSAANSKRGTLDTQDLLLLNFTKGIFAEFPRATELCALGAKWGVEGFIRMECGFELIKCDFSDGLNLLSHKQRPFWNETEAKTRMFYLDFFRDIASRYPGIDGGRVYLDYSSMVSAYFYSANLANPSPDPRQAKLPRLVNSDEKVLQRIKSDVGIAMKDWKPSVGLDWQGVADMIVKRYSARLQWMAAGMPQDILLSQVNMLMNVYTDYGASGNQDPVTVCTEHYLQPIQPSTASDLLIEAAFKSVTRRICSTIYDVRKSLLEKEQNGSKGNRDHAGYETQLIRDLNAWLDWSEWKACGQCGLDEVCYTTVFPWGTADYHYNPRCINNTGIMQELRPKNSYWFEGIDH